MSVTTVSFAGSSSNQCVSRTGRMGSTNPFTELKTSTVGKLTRLCRGRGKLVSLLAGNDFVNHFRPAV